MDISYDTYMILVYGHRLAGYGPFKTEGDARNYADKYFQDYRTEILLYTRIITEPA